MGGGSGTSGGMMGPEPQDAAFAMQFMSASSENDKAQKSFEALQNEKFDM